MDAAALSSTPAHPARRRRAVKRICATFLPLFCLLAAGGIGAFARQPVKPMPAPVTPAGGLTGPHGTRDAKNPDWSTDPNDPFPLPPDTMTVPMRELGAHGRSSGAFISRSARSIGCRIAPPKPIGNSRWPAN